MRPRRTAKGKPVKTPAFGSTVGGDAGDLGDVGRPPGKSSLFLLTVPDGPEIALRGERSEAPKERFRVRKRPERVGRPLKIRASGRAGFVAGPLDRIVLITASGLLGEKPLAK